MLKVAALAKSTYFFELNKADMDDIKNKELCDLITSIFYENKERYGFRRITAELRNKGIVVNHKKVSRIMRKLGLKGKVRKQRYHSYIGEVGHIAENIINRNFMADGPNE